jgi:hypothetical protein
LSRDDATRGNWPQRRDDATRMNWPQRRNDATKMNWPQRRNDATEIQTSPGEARGFKRRVGRPSHPMLDRAGPDCRQAAPHSMLDAEAIQPASNPFDDPSRRCVVAAIPSDRRVVASLRPSPLTVASLRRCGKSSNVASSRQCRGLD